jgi:YfiH family protein
MGDRLEHPAQIEVWDPRALQRATLASERVIQLGPAEVRFTGRAEGDLGHAGAWVEVHEVDAGVAARRLAVVDRPWSWLRQVHGAEVRVVDGPGKCAGDVGDALVTADSGAVLAVLTADCAPIALASDEGVTGAVHAGWRGLVAGVVDAAVGAMRDLGATEIVAALGPCIHAECYEFSHADLDAVAAAFGDGVRGTTAAGRPALDVPAAARSALERSGARLVHDADVCTACSTEHYSHRARAELERQAVVVWRP